MDNNKRLLLGNYSFSRIGKIGNIFSFLDFTPLTFLSAGYWANRYALEAKTIIESFEEAAKNHISKMEYIQLNILIDSTQEKLTILIKKLFKVFSFVTFPFSSMIFFPALYECFRTGSIANNSTSRVITSLLKSTMLGLTNIKVDRDDPDSILIANIHRLITNTNILPILEELLKGPAYIMLQIGLPLILMLPVIVFMHDFWCQGSARKYFHYRNTGDYRMANIINMAGFNPLVEFDRTVEEIMPPPNPRFKMPEELKPRQPKTLPVNSRLTN